jgi:hypothetical protein
MICYDDTIRDCGHVWKIKGDMWKHDRDNASKYTIIENLLSNQRLFSRRSSQGKKCNRNNCMSKWCMNMIFISHRNPNIIFITFKKSHREICFTNSKWPHRTMVELERHVVFHLWYTSGFQGHRSSFIPAIVNFKTASTHQLSWLGLKDTRSSDSVVLDCPKGVSNLGLGSTPMLSGPKSSMKTIFLAIFHYKVFPAHYLHLVLCCSVNTSFDCYKIISIETIIVIKNGY